MEGESEEKRGREGWRERVMRREGWRERGRRREGWRERGMEGEREAHRGMEGEREGERDGGVDSPITVDISHCHSVAKIGRKVKKEREREIKVGWEKRKNEE